MEKNLATTTTRLAFEQKNIIQHEMMLKIWKES